MSTKASYSSPRMPLRMPRRCFRQLCSTLGALLVLHLGVAQPALAHANMTPMRIAETAVNSYIDTPPCHGQASPTGVVMPDRGTATTPSKDASHNHGLRHALCCDAGACHCVADCYVSVITEPLSIGAQDSKSIFSFAVASRPAAPLARELRPPIAF